MCRRRLRVECVAPLESATHLFITQCSSEVDPPGPKAQQLLLLYQVHNRKPVTMRRTIFIISLLCGLLSSQSRTAAVTIIDTFPVASGSIGGFGDGEGTFQTVGQTFTVPADDTCLSRFTFTVVDYGPEAPITFGFYVAAWDGYQATGSVLYQSAVQMTDGNPFVIDEFALDIGGLQLSSGGQYVGFLSTSQYDNVNHGEIPAATDYFDDPPYHFDRYVGGKVVYQQNGSAFEQLFSSVWGQQDGGWGGEPGAGHLDLAFRAEFTSSGCAVPESGCGLVLVSLALGALGLIARSSGTVGRNGPSLSR